MQLVEENYNCKLVDSVDGMGNRHVGAKHTVLV